MMLYRIVFVFALLCLGLNPALAKRVALVVGNSNYQHTTVLANPTNDARLMERALREAGFEVTLVLDADQPKLKRAMLEFGRELRKGVDASLFYYAGHGVQVKGENYLLPVDAVLENEDEVDLQAIPVNAFLQTMESAKSPVNIVVLDACRNNPFSRAFRGTSGGLAPVNAPRGSYIAYATAPGAVAADGEGGNSPYTIALASMISLPDLKLEDVFKRTREKVLASTNEKQVPWETSSITGDFYFTMSVDKNSNSLKKPESKNIVALKKIPKREKIKGGSAVANSEEVEGVRNHTLFTGTCRLQIVEGFFPCDEKVGFFELDNDRSFITFLKDGRVFTVSGGSDRQPNLNNYYLAIDTFRMTKDGKLTAEDKNMEGECHFELNDDASEFFSVKCDVFDRGKGASFKFYLENISSTQRM